MTFFAAMVVVVFSFAFGSEGSIIASAIPGILWVAIAFAGTLGLSRAFDRERESDTMRALLLAPISRTALFAGKAAGILVVMSVVEVVVVPMVALLFDAPLLAHPLPFLVLLVLGTLGFAIVGTVFAAMLLRVRSRDVLLPVVLYPILVPLFIAGTKGTGALLGRAADLEQAWFWIKFLGVYDGAFLVTSLWTFESLGDRMKRALYLAAAALTAALFVYTQQLIWYGTPIDKLLLFNQKIFYYHVPSAFMLFLAVFVCGIASALLSQAARGPLRRRSAGRR